MQTAILVDGAFFLRRYQYLFKSDPSPLRTARYLRVGARYLMKQANEKGAPLAPNSLYRVFYYDCPPMEKRVHNPISNKSINLGQSETAKFRNNFLDELKKSRKFALRLGSLHETGAAWRIDKEKTKDLLRGKIAVGDLKPHDVSYEFKQGGVDMRIGLDIASLAYKKQVGRIILLSGDSDFVPAAKLARREGLDFVLATMGATIREDLYENIDGLISSHWELSAHKKMQNSNHGSTSTKPLETKTHKQRKAAHTSTKKKKVSTKR